MQSRSKMGLLNPLQNSLNPHNAPVWLPYNTIDVILLELRDHQHDDKVYKQVRNNSDFYNCN